MAWHSLLCVVVTHGFTTSCTAISISTYDQYLPHGYEAYPGVSCHSQLQVIATKFLPTAFSWTVDTEVRLP
ncbi:hypothetical protein EDC04DRAFT_2650319 [Pisolithus marmoratus]|nr:hypothetical protein EDC04DRAFT_2650319 [Pisolithus marmoratus]